MASRKVVQKHEPRLKKAREGETADSKASFPSRSAGKANGIANQDFSTQEVSSTRGHTHLDSRPTRRSSPRQLSLAESLSLGSSERAQTKETLTPRTTHGGLDTKGKRKTKRPFFQQTPMLIAVKSDRAKGRWSLKHRKNAASIQAMLYTYAERYQVRIYRAANVGNQLYLLVKAKERKRLSDFLRVLLGQVACRVTGARKGKKKIGRFWDHLAWSRLVNWGRDFYHAQALVLEHEIHGLSRRNQRETRNDRTSRSGVDAWMSSTIKATTEG